MSQGGFVDFLGGAGGFLSSEGTPAKKPRMQQQRFRVVPVTCAMINGMAPGAETLRFGVVEFSQVKIIGYVRAVQKNNEIYSELTIDDMTSSPTIARRYAKDGGVVEDLQSYVGHYVRIHGNVTTFNNAKAIMVLNIAKLHSAEEITQQLLEVIYSKLYLENDLFKHSVDAAMSASQANANGNPFARANVGSSAMGGPTTNASSFGTGLSSLATEIIEYLGQCTEDEGYHYNAIKNHFPHVSWETLKQEMDFLSAEGHIYSTIDENHFKTTI